MGRIKNRNIPMGTVHGLCIYEMWGKVYYRKKSSLTAKRVKKAREFEKTRKHASDMGRAAQIGSIIYKAIPADIKDRWIYRAITGEAASLLYKGTAEEEVKAVLWKKYIEDTNCQIEKAKEMVQRGEPNIFESTRKANLSLRKLFAEKWEQQSKYPYSFKHAWEKRGTFSKERFRRFMNDMGPIWKRAYK
jgi:hypothetical protein